MSAHSTPTRMFVLAAAALALCVPVVVRSAVAQDASTSVPRNPALSPSGWPIFHANTYAQASTPLRGPEAGDRISVSFIPTPGNNVSPWTVLSPPDARGAQAVWGSSTTHIFKAVVDGDTFRMVDSVALPRRRLGFDWNIAVLRDGTVMSTNKSNSAMVRIAEVRPGDAYSPIRVVRTYPLPLGGRELSSHFSIAYDGKAIFLTNDDRIGALDLDTGKTVLFSLDSPDGDFGVHNAFAIDEGGAVFLVSEKGMSRVDWNGRAFRMVWRIAYDFRGPGCERKPTGRIRQAIAVARGQPCTGSGTTPTLLGGRRDGLVIAIDGHSPANRAVAFWRDAPPADWKPLPGQDRRIAGILALPHSTPDGDGFSLENSPSASGWAFTGAQWSGFKPGCNPPTGVQQLRWDPQSRRLTLRWANPDVHLNGVTTYAIGSGLLYSTGRRDCMYRFYALDWRTGAVVLDVPLGKDDRYLDQGNQIVPIADRSLIYGSKDGLVRIRPRPN